MEGKGENELALEPTIIIVVVLCINISLTPHKN